MLKEIVKSPFFNWASRSLIGNIILFEIIMSIPSFIVFSYMDFNNGIFGFPRTLIVAGASALEGLFMGCFIWFFVAKPALKYRRRIKNG